MTDLLCTELSPLPAVSSPLQEDQRRLQILIEQEDRFMPSYHRLHNAGRLSVAEDGDRTRMLEIMHEVCYLFLVWRARACARTSVVFMAFDLGCAQQTVLRSACERLLRAALASSLL